MLCQSIKNRILKGIFENVQIDREQTKKIDHILFVLQGFKTQIGKIMATLTDFITKQTEFADRQDKAVADLQEDVKNLNDVISKLQASQGTVSDEDQVLLDQLTTRGQSLTEKLELLDNLTPPVVPPIEDTTVGGTGPDVVPIVPAQDTVSGQ